MKAPGGGSPRSAEGARPRGARRLRRPSVNERGDPRRREHEQADGPGDERGTQVLLGETAIHGRAVYGRMPGVAAASDPNVIGVDGGGTKVGAAPFEGAPCQCHV